MVVETAVVVRPEDPEEPGVVARKEAEEGAGEVAETVGHRVAHEEVGPEGEGGKMEAATEVEVRVEVAEAMQAAEGMAHEAGVRKADVVGAVVRQVTVAEEGEEMVDLTEVWAAARLEVQEATRAVTESKCSPHPCRRKCRTQRDSSPCSVPKDGHRCKSHIAATPLCCNRNTACHHTIRAGKTVAAERKEAVPVKVLSDRRLPFLHKCHNQHCSSRPCENPAYHMYRSPRRAGPRCCNHRLNGHRSSHKMASLWRLELHD